MNVTIFDTRIYDQPFLDEDDDDADRCLEARLTPDSVRDAQTVCASAHGVLNRPG
jgi:hypothetical protein